MKKIAILFFWLASVQFAFAVETTYVKYEVNSCIQQYYYKAADNSGNGAKAYYDFHVNLTDKERTVVRTQKMGSYKKADYNLTGNLVDCANKKTHTFQSMTGKVATGDKVIYFIEEAKDEYIVYKGISAIYEIYNTDYFYSYAPEYAFKYVYNEDYKPSQKLKEDRESGVITLFSGKSKNGCNDQFGIVQMPDYACSTQVSKEYLRDIGLYVEKNQDGFFMLKKVDGMEVGEYLKWRCSGFRSDLNPANIPAAYDITMNGNTAKGGESLVVSSFNGSAAPSENQAKGESKAAVTNSNWLIASFEGGNTKAKTSDLAETVKSDIPKEYDMPTPQNNNTTINEKHIIKTGDTLYNLSKKYNVSVDELKTWNGLPNSDILIGQELIVKKYPYVL